MCIRDRLYTGGQPNKHSGSTASQAFYSWAERSSSGVLTEFTGGANNYGIAGGGNGIDATIHASIGLSMTYTHTITTLNAITITPVFRSSGSDTVRATEAGADQHITVWAMEIAQ